MRQKLGLKFNLSNSIKIDWRVFCPCHGSKFDMAGRVYAGVPAPSNLEVPPHYYENESILVIGQDNKENA